MEASTTCSPEIGTFIGGGRFQLISVIGKGGYGTVYKAFDTMGQFRLHYAVKCLPRFPNNLPCSRMREVELHHHVADHPGVVTLYAIFEEYQWMYLVMEYAPDRDLFTQILQERRFLGNDVLIRGTFLQILDVVEYCHAMGVYHRDLKPENFVCFDGGLSVGLGDFGLATTEKTSAEFRTGSVYHMSPECHAAEMTCEGVYSPQSCDIWSLGIILINLVTGRNPWNCAKMEDATFRSYYQNPTQYLSTVLPISSELNEVLVMMLCMEWRARPAISEIREAVKRIPSFYSKKVVFDGSVAKLSWEEDRYKKAAVADLEEVGASLQTRKIEQQVGRNNLRRRIFKEKKLLLFGEEEGSDSDDTLSSTVTTATLGSASSLSPSFEKRSRERAKTSTVWFVLSGIQNLFGRFCPSLGRRKGRVVIQEVV